MSEKLPLRWGNPAFLNEYWRDVEVRIFNIDNNYHHTGLVSLKDSIIYLHDKYQNAETKDRHVVIGNGATQVLLALFIAMNPKAVYCIPPYFSRYPKLVNLANTKWFADLPKDTKDLNLQNVVHVVTTPSNPDCRVSNIKRGSTPIILDTVYNWPVYVNPIRYDHDIMVFSAAKAFGLAGSRVGWALIKDKILADKVETIIENMTSGVAIEAQMRVNKVISDIILNDDSIMMYGRMILIERWAELKRLKTPFEILNSEGMFVYCKGKAPEWMDVTPGPEMGVSEEHFRINLGCDKATFDKMIWLLKNS